MTDGQQPAVFHLITRLLRGGAEEVVTNIVFGLDNYDFTVGYGAAADRTQVARLRRGDIGTAQFPLIRHYNPVTMAPAVASVGRYLRRNDIDIVHTHSTEAGIVGRLAATVAGVPHVVHTVHGVPFSPDRNTLLNRFVLACERTAARVTDRIVTNADVIATEYLDRGIGTSAQYRTVHIGIDRSRFQDVPPATDLPGGRPRIVMVGRLAEGKGFDLMLDAAESVCDGDVSVCLVGDGPLTDSLSAEIAERGLADDVSLTGYRDDIPQILAASDIFALPSYREGTPRVIIEAMASGLPVVSTDIAGIPEQVSDGESGYLIQPGDADALTQRLATLLADRELRERMGERGRKRSSRFSITRMLEQTDALYQELLEPTATDTRS